MKVKGENGRLHRALDTALHVVFPCRCVFCRRFMHPHSKIAVCASCMRRIPFAMAYPRCMRCGKPTDGGKYCDFCMHRGGFGYERLSAPYLYQGGVRRALILFKKERYQGFAEVFARHMCAVLAYDCKEIDFDGVVSVPPRKRRMRKEGYDQAETLGRAVAKHLGIPYLPGAMVQLEERAKQSGLTEGERIRNVCGNYAVRKAKTVKGKCILLVDDISTTGSTMQECARMLKNAGAASVYAAAAAVVEKVGTDAKS